MYHNVKYEIYIYAKWLIFTATTCLSTADFNHYKINNYFFFYLYLIETFLSLRICLNIFDSFFMWWEMVQAICEEVWKKKHFHF